MPDLNQALSKFLRAISALKVKLSPVGDSAPSEQRSIHWWIMYLKAETAPIRETIVVKNSILISLAITLSITAFPPYTFADDSASHSYEQELERIYKQYQSTKYFTDFNDRFLFSRIGDITLQSAENLKKANADESAGDKASASANYLRAALGPFSTGDLAAGRQRLDKAVNLACGLDRTFQQTFLNALIAVIKNQRGSSFNGADYKSRAIVSDYFWTTALKIKDGLKQEDDQLIEILANLISCRKEQEQYQSALDLCKREINTLDKQEKTSDPRYFQALTNLAGISAKTGDKSSTDAIVEKLNLELQKKIDAKDLSVSEIIMTVQAANRQLGQNASSDALSSKLLDLIDSIYASGDSTKMEQAIRAVDAIKNGMHFSIASGSKSAEIERTLKLAYKLKLKARGISAAYSGRDLIDLCSYLARSGKQTEALELYRTALKFVPEKGPDASPYRDSLNRQYLSLLQSTAASSPERSTIEAEIKARQAAQAKEMELRLKEADVRAENELAEAGKKQEVDPQRYLSALVQMASIRLRHNRKPESMQLARQAITFFEKVPGTDMDEDFLTALWSFAIQYLRSSDSKEEEHFIYDVCDLVSKRIPLHRVGFASNFELTDPVDYFTGKHRYADAAAYINHLIETQRKTAPKDLDTLISLYESLCQIYSEPEQSDKVLEINKIQLGLTEAKYGPDDPKVKAMKLRMASRQLNSGNMAEAEKAANEVFSGGSSSSGAAAKSDQATAGASAKVKGADKDASTLISSLNDLAEGFLANGKLSEADSCIRKCFDTANKYSSYANIDTWVNRSMNKLVSAYISRQDFTPAESLLSYRIELDTSILGADAERTNETRTLLSEVYWKHSLSALQKQNQAEAKKYFEKSEKDFARVIESLTKVAGADSDRVKEAKRKRELLLKYQKTDADAGSKAVPYHRPLSLLTRHHLKDVENQRLDAPREPLSYAIFGRSEVILAGNSTTASYDSSATNRVFSLTGGDVGSCGTIRQLDEAQTRGGLHGRKIAIEQSTVMIGGTVDASGGNLVPDPTPLPRALAFKPETKVVPFDAFQNHSIVAAENGKIADLGKLKITGEAWTIAPGDYKIDSITLEKNATLTIADTGSNGNKTVRLFLQESTKDSVPFIIDSGSIINKDGIPANFQVWYRGEGALLEKNGSRIFGTIYAPEALVCISGGKNDFFGSIVADEVRLYDQARVVFDKKMPSAKQLGLPPFVVNTVRPGHQPIEQSGGSVVIGPSSRELRLSAANILLLTGHYADALQRYNDLISDDPSSELFNNRACCLLETGNFDDSIKDSSQAIRLSPDDMIPYSTRAEAYYRQGKQELAVSDAKKCIEMVPEPSSSGDLNSIALCHLIMGDYDRALKMLNESTEKSPENVESYKYRKMIFEKQGKKELAEKEETRAREVRQKFAQAHPLNE